MRLLRIKFLLPAVLFCLCIAAKAQVAGRAGHDLLTIAKNGRTNALIVVTPKAGECRFTSTVASEVRAHERFCHTQFPGDCLQSVTMWEHQAALDLARCIELMTGANPTIVDTPEAIAAALEQTTSPVFCIGTQALVADPRLQERLAAIAVKNPVLRADAILLQRQGNRVYLVGANDESHFYAVAELLKQWGCRWYMPTAFGECIPEYATLQIGTLDYAYAPPFEVRRAWLSWLGSTEGWLPFTRHNMMNDVGIPLAHNLSAYVKKLVPPGKSVFNIAIADDITAETVAQQLTDKFAKGENIPLGMDDGIYSSDSPLDAQLNANVVDKYFQLPSQTEAFMVFYNKVAKILQEKHPNSPSKIGFLWYTNNTIPPQRNVIAEKPLVGYLAPIDIDPNHGMDDPKSPSRRELKEMVYRWAEIMQGRLVIYDYDQGMLVWRDIPNPAIQSIRQDIRHYRQAGVLGISTESRGAFATTFINLYIRGQLYWNPEANVDALLADFYRNFYGPAAKPMAQYWATIMKAWEDSVVTEHEFFAAPGIYTPEVMSALKKHFLAAEMAIAPLTKKAYRSRNEQLYLERMQFIRLSYTVLESYIQMVRYAATECDYVAAVDAGTRGLIARSELGKMNSTFTTVNNTEKGYPWWPGEVKQYDELRALTDGTKGTLVAKLPLAWAFRRDAHDTGLVSGWARKPVDLRYWNSVKNQGSIKSHLQNPGHWEMLRTDLYAQAQGVLYPDYTNFNGYLWYRTEFQLTDAQAKTPLHLHFPGLFNEGWLYINGALVSYRQQKLLWWSNDYRYEWDADLTGLVKAGTNTITLRLNNPHHMGGIFRRPFLYTPVEK